MTTAYQLPIDFTSAARFLEALDAAGSAWVFQTFTDSKAQRKAAEAEAKERGEKYRDPLARVLSGDITHLGLQSKLQALQNSGAGVYIQINRGKRGASHVESIRSIFVDCDTPEHNSLGRLRERMPPPTAMVQSSPGKYHVYWAVDDCDLATFPILQTQLALAFDTDQSMKNLDRVMRLPGTWHCKHDPVQVKLISVRPVRYRTAQLQAAPVPAPARSSLAESLLTSAEQYELPTILAPGNRTTPLISYIGHLAAKGYSAEYIEAAVREANIDRCPAGDVPLDDVSLEREVFPAIARFISQRQLETAQRQPAPSPKPDTSATDEGWEFEPLTSAEESTLDEFLKRYIFIEAGPGVADLEQPPTRAVYTLPEFRAAHANKWVAKKQLSQHWLQSPHRQDVRDITFFPANTRILDTEGYKFYNTYTDSGLILPERADPDLWRAWKDHITYMFEDAETIRRFVAWAAFTVQRPETRIPWMPLIISHPGIGKGWLFQSFQKILGAHNCAMIGPDDLTDRKSVYNEYMSGTLLVCLDEMKTSNRWDDMERLKPLITEPNLMINHKYGKKRQERIFANLIAFSNWSDAAAVKEGDRRLWVHKCDAPPRDKQYYQALFGWLDTDGPAHLLKYLLSVDLSGFAFAEPPPMTEAKRRMISGSQSIYEQEICDAIDERSDIFRADIVDVALVERFILRRMQLDKLQTNEKYHIRSILTNASIDLPQERYRVQLPESKQVHRVRCRAIRNFERWRDADTLDVIEEYIRALRISLGGSGRDLKQVREVDSSER